MQARATQTPPSPSILSFFRLRHAAHCVQTIKQSNKNSWDVRKPCRVCSTTTTLMDHETNELPCAPFRCRSACDCQRWEVSLERPARAPPCAPLERWQSRNFPPSGKCPASAPSCASAPEGCAASACLLLGCPVKDRAKQAPCYCEVRLGGIKADD